jgi:hypothetical protein
MLKKKTFANRPRPDERARCSAWANALGGRATAIKPDVAKMIQEAQKVKNYGET